MTVKAYGEASKFQGVSGDVMPNNADEGATFDYIDTGESYIFHDGLWEYDYKRSIYPDNFYNL
jgi:hypothetical protein